MKKDNRIVVDLGKVQFAKFRYRNQYGQLRDTLPPAGHFTVRSILHDKRELSFRIRHDDKPETMYEQARRRQLLDVWVPETYFQLTANHSLVYTGKKAVSMYKEWTRRIFKKG